jgi:hypothetical protein
MDVFDTREDLDFTVEEQTKNARKWIDKLTTTQCKKQTLFLGSEVTGYSVLGVGCKAVNVDFYPDEMSNKNFQKSVGLLTEKGAFSKALRYNDKYYKSLYYMGLDLSFRRIGNFMKKARVIRALFKEGVAQNLIKIYVKKGRKPANTI